MSSSHLPQNFGYRKIKSPVCPTILGHTIPTKMNPNGPSCDFPGDPNILPFFTLVGFYELTKFDEIEIA
jgi:hypothetical protein